MHYTGLTLGFLLPSYALYAVGPVVGAPSVAVVQEDLYPRDPSSSSSRVLNRTPLSRPHSDHTEWVNFFDRRDGDHAHGNHHAGPIVELNETEITMYHAPTPPSYWSIDVEERDPEENRYPGLMVLHALSMCAAFFGALPAGEWIWLCLYLEPKIY